MTFPITHPTPTYSPITARRAVARSKGAPYLAEVGADDGRIWGPPGYVYVREPLSYDLTTGRVTGGQTYLVRGHGNFLCAYGTKVWVQYIDRYDEWMIIETDPDSLIAQDIDPNILNQLNPYNKYIDTLQLLAGNPYPVSNASTASTEVQFKNLHWLDYRGRHQLWSVDPFDRPDLSDYEPASGLKRLVHFWARHDGTISVSQGTAIDQSLAFQPDVHLTEVLEDRPDQLAIPLGAMVMNESDTSIGDDDRYPMDTRPWITNVKNAGFPNPVDRNYLVPAGVSEIVTDKLTVTAKLTIEGKLTIIDGHPLPDPPKPVGPVYLAKESLYNTVEACTISADANAVTGGILWQNAPADDQTVYRSRAYLTEGIYQVRCLIHKDTSGAKFKVSLIGLETVTTAVMDGYNNPTLHNQFEDNNVTLTKVGEYRIEVITDGKNALSTNYYIFLQSISITRI